MATGVGPNLLVLGGLAWAAARCVGLMSGRRRGPRALLFVPHLTIALGFWLSRSTDTIWVIIAVGAVLALTSYALRRLREPSGATLASVLGTSVLVELGSLLIVRLVVVRDPAAPFGSGLTAQAWVDARWPLVLPLALAGAALVVGAAIGGRVARWTRPWRARRGVLGLLIVAALALFALPLLPGPGRDPDRLTFLGVATPEYGKIAFLVVLALLVARGGHRLSLPRPRGDGPPLGVRARARVLRLRYRHAAYPLGLFALVAAISAARHDFGTVVPALAATVGVTWSAARQPTLDRGGRRSLVRVLRTLRGYRATGLAILAMVGLAGLLAFAFTDYLGERAHTWVDPWRYRWDAGCAAVPGDRSGLCQESLVANVESANSQVSRALAVIADGGLWGRGLADPTSAIVPAGESDFVLAVMWSKLGGVAVLLAALLIVLVAASLRQATRTGRSERDALPTAAGLFASGLAAMIVGQFLFVFAATLNVVPHSGIPVPFLSRGGQATLALLLGVMLLLAVAPSAAGRNAAGRPGAGPRAGASSPAAGPSPAWLGVTVPVGLCLLLAGGITVAPYQSLTTVYGEDRPLCPMREPTRESLTSPPPDPLRCSTDQIVYNRTRVELHFPDGLRLAQQRPTGTWVIAGDLNPGGLTLTDLTGLVRIGVGGAGIIDTVYAPVVAGTVPPTLAGRLTPRPSPSTVDGLIELTLSPALQHAVAVALRSDVDASGPLAGGLVAIDATSGEILAAASVPGLPAPSTSGPARTPAQDAFLLRHDQYGRPGAQGLDGTRPDATCTRDAVVEGDPAAAGCWRWSGAGASAPTGSDLLRYVGGDPSFPLPEPAVNRALRQPYDLGALAHLLITAAYVERLHGHADDLIAGDGCRGALGGRITVTAALAVSCDAAFTRLAAQVGWAALADQARRLGFPAGRCDAGSCLAPSIDAPIGGELRGTPLAMAAMMAAIANGGQARPPTFARSLTFPDSGRTETPRREPATALTGPAAAELVQALSRTAADGAAAGLQATVGAPLWIQFGLTSLAPGPGFARYHAWTAGFLRSRHGPIAFAAVVETRDGPAGALRLRQLVENVARTVGVVAP